MEKINFQSEHGAAFAQIAAHPAFFAALQFCDSETLTRLSRLTPEQIKENGPAILAEYVGRLKLQNELLALTVPEGELNDPLPPDDYTTSPFDPSEPIVRSESITFAPVKDFASEFAAIPPEQPPARKRGRPKGSKNKK